MIKKYKNELLSYFASSYQKTSIRIVMDKLEDEYNKEIKAKDSYNINTLKSLQDLKEQVEFRTCRNCKHFSLNTETPSKNYCEKLGVADIGGCVDYFEVKNGIANEK